MTEQFTFRLFKKVSFVKVFDPKIEKTITYKDGVGLGINADLLNDLANNINDNILLLQSIKGVI